MGEFPAGPPDLGFSADPSQGGGAQPAVGNEDRAAGDGVPEGSPPTDPNGPSDDVATRYGPTFPYVEGQIVTVIAQNPDSPHRGKWPNGTVIQIGVAHLHYWDKPDAWAVALRLATAEEEAVWRLTRSA